MGCIFCEIVDRKAYAEILFENKRVISFLDIRPLNYGHSLVIPKTHYENFLDIPGEELEEIIKGTQIISKAMSDSLHPHGFNIVANNGIAAGQSVFHFHFHIIPRFNNDGVKTKLNLKSYENNSIKKYADKIRFALTK